MAEDAKSTNEALKAVSRRKFIQGVIAGGAGVSSATYLFRASHPTSAAGTGERLITLNVNGQRPARGRDEAGDAGHDAALQARPHRNQDRLRPRRVRSVYRADRRRAALLLLDADAYRSHGQSPDRGRAWRTPDGTLHPVQQGIIEEQGFQCAFCMSGFMMAAVGFLQTNPNPTRAELAHGVSGNLCRCQDYDKILTALMRGGGDHAGGKPCLIKPNTAATTN